MVIKWYPTFIKISRLESHHQRILCPEHDTRWSGSYPWAEIQSMYSTASLSCDVGQGVKKVGNHYYKISICFCYHQQYFTRRIMTYLPSFISLLSLNAIGCGYRIHRLHLCRWMRLPERVSWYDTKQSDGEAPEMLELWAMQSTRSLPSHSGRLWPGVVAHKKVLSMGQIEMFDI